jgi:amidophosphoribosyltransferase
MPCEQIRQKIGADSLAFISVEGLLASVPPDTYCLACFNGEYPVEIPPSFSAGKFLDGYRPNNLHHASPASQMQIEDVLRSVQEEGDER